MATLKKLILEKNKLIDKKKIEQYLDDSETERYAKILLLIKPLQIKLMNYITSKGIKNLSNDNKKILLKYYDEGKMTTEKEVDTEFKKFEETPTTKAKKSIILENGSVKPVGFTPAEKKIVRLIDVDIYSEDEIINIMKGIVQGKFKKLSDFPKPETENESESEPEPIKEVKPLSKATIKANADKAKKKLKEAAAKKKADEKEAKRLKNIKPYFKADDPPKGFREATPLEAVKEKKVMLYGKKKVDSKLIDSMFKPAGNSKDMIQSIMLKLASKVPKLKNLKAVIDGMEGDERYDSTDKKAEFAKLRAEILALSEKKKKLEAKQK